MRTDRQTDRQNHTITEADDRDTHATTVGVSNDVKMKTMIWLVASGYNVSF